MDLSIIIPLYNEEQQIIPLLERLFMVQMPDCIGQYEVLVVDDGSSDNSAQLVKEYVALHPTKNIRLLRLGNNRGKGAAIKHGLAAASGLRILIQDADLELIPEDIPSMIDAMEKLDVDFVNGSRYLPGVLRPMSSYRRYLVNMLFSWLTSICINVRITDMACGYKLFRTGILSEFELREERFGVEAELIIKALRRGKTRVTEVPVHYFPRNYGEGKKFRTIDGLNVLEVILRYGLMGYK
jgi:glycosyltransferase involved in cell wall biosynthesis